MKDIKLYHGSRGGIEGDIEPCSRLHCDFGKGFYMGTDKQQAKSLVCNEHAPVFIWLSSNCRKFRKIGF
jgi:hypothetical protein